MMVSRRSSLVVWGLAGLLGVGFPLASPAQTWEDDYDEPDPYREAPRAPGSVSLRGGVGFTLDPGAFEMGLGVPIHMSEQVALTPHLLIAFDDDDRIVAPTVNVEIHLRIADPGEPLHRLRPYLQAGLGFAYIDQDDEDGVGFLVAPGFGVEYELTRSLFVGSNMRFHVLPSKTGGERFFFSWELFSLRVAF